LRKKAEPWFSFYQVFVYLFSGYAGGLPTERGSLPDPLVGGKAENRPRGTVGASGDELGILGTGSQTFEFTATTPAV
jgi:hypothetical protein